MYLGVVLSQSLEGADILPAVPDSCFPVVGCFSNQPPWISPVRPAMPPQHPENVTTTMHFYNRRNPQVIEFQIFPDNNVLDVPFDKNAQTYVLFHCFMRNNTLPWIMELKNEILNKVDGNVFVIKYNPEEREPSNEQNAGDIRVMGKMVQMVLSDAGVDVKKVHLIGYAGGAHAAAYAAQFLQEVGKSNYY